MGALVSDENQNEQTTLNQTQDEINAIADKWDISSFDEENQDAFGEQAEVGGRIGSNKEQAMMIPQISEQQEQQSSIHEIEGIKQRKHLALNIVTRGIGLESSDSEDELNTVR